MLPSQEINWPRILLIYAIGVFAAMAVSQVVPVIGLIARTFHPANQSAVGLVISLPSLIVALGALATGWLVDKFSAKPILLIGAAILLVGDIAAAYAPSFNGLLAARIIEGIGYVGVAVAAVTMISRATSGTRRTWSLALWSSFVPMSFIVPFLVTPLIFAAGDWRLAFTGHAVVLLILAILAFVTLPSGALIGQMGARSANLGQVLRSPWPYLLGISFGAAACVQSGVVASISSYWAAHYRFADPNVNLFNAIAMVANIVGCLLVGRFISAGVPVWIIGIAGTILAAVAGLAIFETPIPFMTAVIASWVFTFGCGLLVGMWTLLPRVAPSPAATGATSGLVTQFTLLGVLVGSPLAFATEFAPSPLPVALFILLSLAVGLVAFPIWRGAPRREGVGVGH